MLDIRITRIENLESVIFITAEIIKPQHYGDSLDGGETKEALELQTERLGEFLHLHLGHSILSQKGG